jgi:peroxiredoxin
MGLGVVALALGSIWVGPPISAATDSALREAPAGRKPNFELVDITGATRNLADHAGRPVLVHFFATWCEPCRPEMESLQRLAAREDATAIRILAISVAEPDGRVRRFFESAPVSFPVLLDRDRATAKAWGVATLPTTFLLDPDLVPRLFIERDLAWDRLDLQPILDTLSPRGRNTPPSTGGNT